MHVARMPEAESKEPSSAADTDREEPADWAADPAHAIEGAAAGKKLIGLARATWIERGTRSSEDVVRCADQLGISESDATTPLGNAIRVLGAGPEDDAERKLGTALVALALAEAWEEPDADDGKLASTTLALSARSAFDLVGAIDPIMGDRGERVWRAIAARVQKFDRGEAKSTTRGEAALGCAALAASSSTAATHAREGLELRTPLLAGILATRGRSPEPSPTHLQGELLPAPRSAFVTALLALTGILLFLHLLRLVARLALVYRTPAQITLSRAGVQVRAKTMLLGRTLSETETRIGRESLAQATREVRFPRLGLYAGLLALAVGSYVGVGTLSDGVRSASLSLLLTGFVIVAAGVGLDLLLTSAGPGARGRCRVVFVATKGRSICVGGIDAARADEALDVLKA